MNDGYRYGDMVGEIRRLASAYSFVEAYPIGRSVLGRPLLALRIGGGSRPVHINASFHANEWITSALLVRFLSELSDCYRTGRQLGGQDVSELCCETTLWAVPMVNPDGVELVQGGLGAVPPYYRDTLLRLNGRLTNFDGWKANIRGVDLNDQFPAYWEEERKRRGMEGPGPRDFPGPYPLSEPEAAAMAAFTDQLRFRAVVALHTQGREIYWNYRDYEPPQSEALARKLGAVSGYEPVKLTGSDAGYKDWFIQNYRLPGFTVEAGFGENPLPIRAFESIYAELRPLLIESLRL